MDVFALRDNLIRDYATYIRSFIQIRDPRIQQYVQSCLDEGLLWPDPLIQLNPSFEPGAWISTLVEEGVLHAGCSSIFRIKSIQDTHGKPMRLHKHQTDAIHVARRREHYVLTTGTGSGKSLAYIVPIVDTVLREGTGKGIQAIIVYPMNALANSQAGELEKFLKYGFPEGGEPVTYARYTGQESDAERAEILARPPDILLTNYVMLELILTRPFEKPLIERAQGLRYLVLDEMHTYRGRQGADVALLVRRVRDALNAAQMQCIGTSATIAGEGSFEEQQAEVARIASLLFGAEVKPQNIIGETLRRSTPERDFTDPSFIEELRQRVADPSRKPPLDYPSFIADPLSSWIESAFGITREPSTDRLIRRQPRSLTGENGAAQELSQLTGESEARCEEVIREGLLGGYLCERNPETGFPAFAFRLHQFLSRGDTVYASLEGEEKRYITVHGQQYVPGDRSRVLLPLVFCRECGQEYYSVRRCTEEQSGRVRYIPRDPYDQYDDEDGEAGFLHVSDSEPWPDSEEAMIERLPDDWVEFNNNRWKIHSDQRRKIPQPVRIGADGYASADDNSETSPSESVSTDSRTIRAHYLSAPFRFCLQCGAAYSSTQRDDFAKLSTLSTEGRSTATTILSLSAIRQLRQQQDLEEDARKLLSFTDNRQDASLQAGHFNDFVEISLLRSAIYAAVEKAGDEGLRHEELTQKVFEAMALPKSLYAANPEERFQAERETERAFRNLLGYRIYRDLKRGWRVTAPNLEQCGLLQIRYESLQEACNAEDLWQGKHLALVDASPETRQQVARTLLDYMRRELAIKVDYLDSQYQEQIRQQSSQRLRAPWTIEESEKMETSTVLLPRSRQKNDYGGLAYLSTRSGFARYLRRQNTFPDYRGRLTLEETEIVIRQLLDALTIAGIVVRASEPEKGESVPGYQLVADAMRWVADNGLTAFYDPIRAPRQSSMGSRTNPFFVEFYRSAARDLHYLESREHTAQVSYDERQEREARFREAKLPILYCSPTMELGVDISRLNVVNMRNIPPTPANYAQRSGRAGRSGLPALVFSYCTAGNSHDQYFFKRPERMVAGAVTPPRLDLANEDLVRAHVHAIWLAATGYRGHTLSLGKSLKDILDLSGNPPTLKLLETVQNALDDPDALRHARERADRVLQTLTEPLSQAYWWSPTWLEETLSQVRSNFEAACSRWRDLYLCALKQQQTQNAIVLDASRPAKDKEVAKRLRAEAEQQLKLLTEVENVAQSDFYSYRYFASEGFLPGYNFPRLPLSAYIPARRSRQRDEFLSRPRFLAISEFGPRSIVYHEGARYQIHRAILPVGDHQEEDEIFSRQAKLCPACGYLHPLTNGRAYDTCERCEHPLEMAITRLFRMQNVATRRRDRISCDEEERQRMGYEIRTGVRFADGGHGTSCRTAILQCEDTDVGSLTYGHTATLWRINMGWTRRRNRQQFGFILDVERGYWARNQDDPSEGEDTDSLSARTARVIPYVEDRRNCLLLALESEESVTVMASLQAALKNAIQVVYQLEDNELAAEPLPSAGNRRILLFYESAEGGAGVLRRLVDDTDALRDVAREALRLCHFDPDTGDDLRRAPKAREDCEAACYDCLMSYVNQKDHGLLDRMTIRDLLMKLSRTAVSASPTSATRTDHRDMLLQMAGSELERTWIRLLDRRGYRLPTHAQQLISECQTRPDFLYREQGHQAAIYIDGPPHDFPDRQKRDAAQTECMEDLGYLVIRFRHNDDWEAILAKYPSLFGRPA